MSELDFNIAPDKAKHFMVGFFINYPIMFFSKILKMEWFGLTLCLLIAVGWEVYQKYYQKKKGTNKDRLYDIAATFMTAPFIMGALAYD